MKRSRCHCRPVELRSTCQDLGNRRTFSIPRTARPNIKRFYLVALYTLKYSWVLASSTADPPMKSRFKSQGNWTVTRLYAQKRAATPNHTPIPVPINAIQIAVQHFAHEEADSPIDPTLWPRLTWALSSCGIHIEVTQTATTHIRNIIYKKIQKVFIFVMNAFQMLYPIFNPIYFRNECISNALSHI